MHKSLMLLPFLFCASPVLAQSASAPRLADPAMTDRLADTMQVLSRAFLDLRVGELKAAAEGREATSDEKKMTVRDIARHDDPDFDRKIDRQVAEARPMMRQGMKALNDALPQMMQGFAQAQKSLERAIANMPDPTYPKR